MPRFEDIPQFTRAAGYAVDIGWDYLPQFYAMAVEDGLLNVCPDFQRGYVWTMEQKIRYIEFVLQGGATGRDIYTNCPDWHVGGRTDYVLVDGKQRLDAVLGFLNNEIPIFGGNYRRDYTGPMRSVIAGFRWHVNQLKTRDEVLQWYIDLNRGGTVHSDEEIDRVRAMQNGTPYVAPTPAEIIQAAQLDREIIQKAKAEERRFQKEMAEQRAKADAERAAKGKRSKKGARKA